MGRGKYDLSLCWTNFGASSCSRCSGLLFNYFHKGKTNFNAKNIKILLKKSIFGADIAYKMPKILAMMNTLGDIVPFGGIETKIKFSVQNKKSVGVLKDIIILKFSFYKEFGNSFKFNESRK